MNKFSFIKELLENEKFNSNQKERFLKLVTKELEKTNGREIELIKDVDVIKEKLGLNKPVQKAILDSNKLNDTVDDWNINDYYTSANDVNTEKENELEEILLRFNLEYLESINRDNDPRNTTLEERIEFLSKVTDKNYEDRKPLIEFTREKHKDLKIAKAINAINRVYFIVKQIEVMNGDYEHIGISSNTFIIPPDITKEIIQRTQKSKTYKQETEKSKKTEDSIKLHKPLETKNFLSLFNNSDHLKFLTHRFNSDKRDYDMFIQSCKDEFGQAKVKYYNVPLALLRRIEEFAFKENPKWFIREGNEKIFPKKGWSEKSFVEWYKKDINNHPGNDSKWNNEMIIPFKETIEVIAGNLPKILEEAIELGLASSRSNFSIKMVTFEGSDLKSAEFYTDVDKLQNTLFLIFSIIKEVAHKNLCFELKISYENETINGGEYKKLIITHIGSEPTKHSNDPGFAKGDLKSIQNNLWGLCNYEITGKFPDGYRKRIFLTDNIREYKDYVEPKRSQEIDSKAIIGFSHILKFY